MKFNSYNTRITIVVIALICVSAQADPNIQLCSNKCAENCQSYTTNCATVSGTMFDIPFKAIKFTTLKSDPSKWTVAVFNSSTTCSQSTIVAAYPGTCAINTCCNMDLDLSGVIMSSFIVHADVAVPNSTPQQENPNSDHTVLIVCLVLGVAVAVAIVVGIVLWRKKRASYSAV